VGLTRPRNYPNPPGPPGERIAMCDLCSMNYYRSTMVRLPGGALACTDGNCHTGMDAVTSERENAMAASQGYPAPPSGADW